MMPVSNRVDDDDDEEEDDDDNNNNNINSNIMNSWK
jgi:hypothetical protein